LFKKKVDFPYSKLHGKCTTNLIKFSEPVVLDQKRNAKKTPIIQSCNWAHPMWEEVCNRCFSNPRTKKCSSHLVPGWPTHSLFRVLLVNLNPVILLFFFFFLILYLLLLKSLKNCWVIFKITIKYIIDYYWILIQ
jgi:hypothetical protein